jgi:hypothetical protein
MSLKLEERCNKAVRDAGSSFYRTHQCKRRAVKDGMCAFHHPDAVAARNKVKEERWKAHLDARYRASLAAEIGGIILDTLYMEGKLGTFEDWGKASAKKLLARYLKGEKKRNG